MRTTRETPSTVDWWSDSENTETEAAAEFDQPSLADVPNGRSWAQQLRKTIEGEIVPRLMMAHRLDNVPCGPAKPVQIEIQEDAVEQFAALVVEHNLDVLRAYVSTLCEQGQSLQWILLELFAPAARHLGQQWEQDTRDFAEVTLGLSRLQQLLQEYGRQLEPDGELSEPSGRALLLAAQGEQHTFGLSILAEFFRGDGWDVHSGTMAEGKGVLSNLQECGFDVVGFSASQESMIDPVASCIRDVRNNVDARQVHIMVGGRVFLDNPALVSEVGADSTASDANRAVQRARFYLGQRTGRNGS